MSLCSAPAAGFGGATAAESSWVQLVPDETLSLIDAAVLREFPEASSYYRFGQGYNDGTAIWFSYGIVDGGYGDSSGGSGGDGGDGDGGGGGGDGGGGGGD